MNVLSQKNTIWESTQRRQSKLPEEICGLMLSIPAEKIKQWHEEIWRGAFGLLKNMVASDCLWKRLARNAAGWGVVACWTYGLLSLWALSVFRYPADIYDCGAKRTGRRAGWGLKLCWVRGQKRDMLSSLSLRWATNHLKSRLKIWYV